MSPMPSMSGLILPESVQTAAVENITKRPWCEIGMFMVMLWAMGVTYVASEKIDKQQELTAAQQDLASKQREETSKQREEASARGVILTQIAATTEQTRQLAQTQALLLTSQREALDRIANNTEKLVDTLKQVTSRLTGNTGYYLTLKEHGESDDGSSLKRH